MWKCKHCDTPFDFSSVSDKANHTRWCAKNPKRNDSFGLSAGHDKRHGVKKEFSVECHSCKSAFVVVEREKLFPSKDKYFCSRTCANSVGGNAKAQKYHSDEDATYRVVAFRYHKKECVVCGEKNIVSVHHLNEDHSDNRPENLVPICPTHHQYVHSKYRWMVQDKIDKYMEEWAYNSAGRVPALQAGSRRFEPV